MGMMPIEFFESFVEGNRQDCHNDKTCVRRAFNAAVAASHLADHYFKYGQAHFQASVSEFENFSRFVENLSLRTDGAFRDIRSISNAYKHLYTWASCSVSSCGAIELVEFKDSDCDLDNVSQQEAVYFTRRNGSSSEFLPVLDKVVNYWRDLFYGVAFNKKGE
jgi:hypothetical protein